MKAKALSFPLIKQKVPGLLAEETRRKPYNEHHGAKPKQHPLRGCRPANHPCRREESATAIGGAETGHSVVDESGHHQGTSTTNSTESNLVAHTTQGETPSMMQKTRSRRQDIPLSITPCANHLDHLPGPPPRHATARTGATAPHDSATHSPSCTR